MPSPIFCVKPGNHSLIRQIFARTIIMTITQLEYFAEVAKCKSISKAARNLFITQPALGRQIDSIEKELGVTLLSRTNQGASLTEAGGVFYSEINNILKDYKAAIMKTKLASSDFTGILSIGVLEYLLVDDLLSDIINHFEQNHPEIKLNIFTRSYRALLEDILSGKADAVISMDFNFYEQPLLECENIIRVTPSIAMPVNHALSKKEDLSFSDFKDVTIVNVSPDDCPHAVDTIVHLCKEEGGFLPKLYFADSMKDVMLWVRAGNHCSIINDRMEISDPAHIKIFPLTDVEKHYIQIAIRTENDNPSLKLLNEFFDKLRLIYQKP